MKLNSDGVTISVLILIFMILICHTMNYLYPKNRFKNIPQTTNYNQIYYDNINGKICSNVNKVTTVSNVGNVGNVDNSDNVQAEVPCTELTYCDDNSKPLTSEGLASLSDSEIAVIYKVVYEDAAREIFMRTLKNIAN